MSEEKESKPKKEYGTTWDKLKILSLGGKWAFGVGIIKEKSGDRKIRMVKGKLTNPLKKSGEWKEIDLTQDPNPISQVQKMNFKRREEYKAMIDTLDEMFNVLEKEQEKT
ncbi:MAG: hypothetical protein EAX96_00940 [Candidatus Lokiarchaeota archaeon]|nr:hypothetical protein [Candidatus Lokiarchaeota archaeon]